jgi:hypothetical protein
VPTGGVVVAGCKVREKRAEKEPRFSIPQIDLEVLLMANRPRQFQELLSLVHELFKPYVADKSAQKHLKEICGKAKHLVS